jgi:hypothetical protein
MRLLLLLIVIISGDLVGDAHADVDGCGAGDAVC